MTDRETAFVTMIRLDVPDAEPEQVEVYADDGLPVDPARLDAHMGTQAESPAADTVTVTRAELADMIADAAAAAATAQAVKNATPTVVRAAARAAITAQTDNLQTRKVRK